MKTFANWLGPGMSGRLPVLHLDLSELGNALPNNLLLGAATPGWLHHGAYNIVIEGESFRKPEPIPENGENAIAKSSKKPHP